MMLIEKKEAFFIWATIAAVVYCSFLYLLELKAGGRIHWLAAMLLGLGGPHLLCGVMGIISGWFAALCYQIKSDERGNKNK